MKAGEVHAVVGENGAGKSTLMKILSGVYKADEGEIIFKGDHVTYTTPREAQEAGITTIYQELVQIPLLSVMENIFLGSEIMRGPFIDWPEMRRQSQKLLEKLRLDVDPRTQLSTLGVGLFRGHIRVRWYRICPRDIYSDVHHRRNTTRDCRHRADRFLDATHLWIGDYVIRIDAYDCSKTFCIG